jgi:hypothetical protein
VTTTEEMIVEELRAAARQVFAQTINGIPDGWSGKYVNGWNDAVDALVDQVRRRAEEWVDAFRPEVDTGGWSLEASVYKPDLTCLVSDEGTFIRHEDNPLSPQQMKSLGAALIRAAEKKRGEER